MEIKRWYKLLDYWCHEEKRYGLTIPFLVGAIKAKGAEELLCEIKDGDDQRSHPVVLNFCDVIGEYVLAMPPAPIEYFNNCKAFGRLYIDDDYLEELVTFEQLVKFINTKYDQYIKARTYSKDGNKWTDFSPIEEKLIYEVKAN